MWIVIIFNYALLYSGAVKNIQSLSERIFIGRIKKEHKINSTRFKDTTRLKY